ncbi:hypothetical protein [uncultured Gimesia sp.]|uniref:hypothetical protein n=1 Tax=uncultured Gimesia sp. TaxID=1678688 RepID=UPI0030DBE445
MSVWSLKVWLRGGISFSMFWCLASIFGCAPESGEQPELVELSYPETFTATGINWRREQKLGPSDSRLLTRYFRGNPSLADSPAFQGRPAVYHGTQNRRRFYWIQGTVAQCVWVCVQYDRRRFQFLEGTGTPWRDKLK